MRYLAEGESVVVAVRRHPVVLAAPLLLAVGGIAAAAVIGFLLSPDDPSGPIDTLLGLLGAYLVLRFGWKLWLWWEDRVVVTDRRILEISGVLTRKVATMPLAKVTDMTYRRTVAGRLFGYGDLLLESAGADQALSGITYIPDPDRFYRQLTSLLTAALPEPNLRPEEDDTGPLPRVIV
jgi:uncharacterized membrane protein YdbT with pleckstrin-like domain